jgi:hypothetical protein
MPYDRQEIEVGFCDGKFLAGSHICYLYGEPDERLRMLALFFGAGGRARERLMFVYDRESPDEARRELARFGFVAGDDFELCRAPYRDAAADQLLEGVKRFYEDAIGRGYTGTRATGEMAALAADGDSTEQVLQYEAKLTDVLAQYPTTAICGYDVRLFSGATIMDVLNVHPFTVVHGQIVANPYFIEPAQFLARYGAARG